MSKSQGNSLIKTSEEIQLMREGGKILSKIVHELALFSENAKCTFDIENLAEKLVNDYGVVSAFKGQYDYKYNTCLSVGDAIIHGIPNMKPLNMGDVLKIDMGIIFENMYLDHATTVVYGESNEDFDKGKFNSSLKIRNIAREILQFVESSPNIKAGCLSRDISFIIDSYCQRKGYFPCEDYVGHGVGHSLHEQPDIFCFFDDNLPKFVLEEGMTIAIEPMISEKRGKTYIDVDDEFTVRIKNGGLSAFFEDSVLITANGIEVLTKF